MPGILVGQFRIAVGLLIVLGSIGWSELASAEPQRRVALVIGNSAYQQISRLANPANDARLVGETLQALDFDLIGREPLLDLDFLAMRRAIRAFGEALKGGAVGLFYYAGHGIEYRGQNYLVPVNASLSSENDIEFDLIDANLVLRQMELAGNDLNMLILDACRNNPFASRGFRAVGRGLGRMDAPAGTIVSFATRPGDVAADGSGANSPFTSALARAIQTPNLGVLEVFNKVGVLVKAETGAAQQPWLSSSPIEGQFYFKLEGTPPVKSSSATTPAFDARMLELALWQSIEDSDEPADFEDYLAQYPNGTFAGPARRRMNSLKEKTKTAAIVPPPGFAVTEMDETLVAVKNANVRDKPSTEDKKVGRLSVESLVEVTGKLKDRNWLRIAYEGRVAYVFAPLLKAIDLDELTDWQKVKGSRQANAFETFLKDHPDGYFAGRAKTLLAALIPPPKPATASPSVQPAVGVYPETHKPGDAFRDCTGCPEMVVVPAGSFMMGSPNAEVRRFDDEGPQYRVTISRPFAVGKYEVTFADWDACTADGGCKGYRPNDRGWGRGRRPVIDVSWHDARAFTQWLSGKTSKPYRLLTEAEWEYSARAGTQTPFSFGRTITPDQANYDGNYKYDGGPKGRNLEKTAPVGSYPANAFGLNDMHGNVWEWVEDCYNDSYRGAPRGGGAWTSGNCSERVLRGGSWVNPPGILRSAYRNRYGTGYRISYGGFRVARTLDR